MKLYNGVKQIGCMWHAAPTFKDCEIWVSHSGNAHFQSLIRVRSQPC